MSRKKMPLNEHTLGGRLRLYRESKGANVAMFAKLIDISHSSLSDIENNKSKPSTKPLDSLIRKTDIDIYWLFTGEGEMTRGPKNEAKGKAENEIEDKPLEAKELNGLWGKTKFQDVEGKRFKITEFGPDEDSESEEIRELLIMTRNVLESGTGYAQSLALNVRSLHESVEMKRTLRETTGTQREIKGKDDPAELEKVKKRLDELEAKLAEKEQEPTEGDPSSTKRYA